MLYYCSLEGYIYYFNFVVNSQKQLFDLNSNKNKPNIIFN